MIMKEGEKITPLEKLYERKPSMDLIRTFGCHVFTHVPQEMCFKTDPALDNMYGFLLFDLIQQKTFQSSSVLFDEYAFGISELKKRSALGRLLRYYVEGENKTSLDDSDDVTSHKVNDFNFYDDEENFIEPSESVSNSWEELTVSDDEFVETNSPNGEQIEAGLQDILPISESSRRYSNVHLFDDIKNEEPIPEDEEILKLMNINLEPIKKEKEELIESFNDEEADDVVIDLSSKRTNPNSLSTPLKTQRAPLQVNKCLDPLFQSSAHSSTVHRTLFNDPEPESEPDIESDSNYNLNSNSENEHESVKEEPQPCQSSRIAASPPHHPLMNPNLAPNHLHGHNFFSHLHHVMFTNTVILNKKTPHLFYQAQRSEQRNEWIEACCCEIAAHHENKT